jgi:hypothetical protein
MSKSLDFTKLKKQHLTVTLADEKNTKLLITTPTKKVLDEFLTMKDSLTGDTAGEEAINELYAICAKLMSQNKNRKKITTEMVEDLFDFEDLVIFITAYSEFISEVASSKNF